MLKKPYIKKFGKTAGFAVWVVDGKYIRKNIDEEFMNFGQHYQFKFIPKKEFWIDKQYGDGDETRYFVENLLIQYRLMAKGIDYRRASDIGESKEMHERAKHEIIMKEMHTQEKREHLFDKVRKRQLKAYSKEIQVWVVIGRLVRDFFFINFTEGGHDLVYSFIPKKEIWIDDDISQKERKFVLLHELHERNLMAKGMNYEEAHNDSSKVEFSCRNNPKTIDKLIKKELKKAKRIKS